MMMKDRLLKHLRERAEARKRYRGWPIATIALYGLNLSQATKVPVGIVTSKCGGELLIHQNYRSPY